MGYGYGLDPFEVGQEEGELGLGGVVDELETDCTVLGVGALVVLGF